MEVIPKLEKDITNRGNMNHNRGNINNDTFGDMRHTGETTYKCSSSSGLKIHQQTHSGVNPYQCSICQKCLTVQVHKRLRTKDSPYQCQVCDRRARQTSNVLDKDLMEFNRDENRKKLPIENETRNEESLIMENGTVWKNISSTIENAISIEKCDNEEMQGCKTKDDVFDPTKSEFIKCDPMRGNETETQRYDYYEIKVLAEDVVDIKVESDQLQSNDHYVDGDFPMKEPKENGKTEQQLIPLKKIRKVDAKICSVGVKVKLEKYSSVKKRLIRPKLSQCTLCDKKTTNLKKHMIEAHSDIERPFQCYTCDKTYKEFNRLRYHIRRHSDPVNYICHVCAKGFFLSSDLTKHIFNRHENIRPFKCEECAKSFKTRSDLHLHGRTHSGDKPFTCDVCLKSFTTSGSLKIHSRHHSGDKPYVCSFCGKCFSESSTHTQHERIHSGFKPYKCHLCDRRTAQAGNLKSHYRHHHKMIVKHVTMFHDNTNAVPIMEPIQRSEPVMKGKLRKKKI